MDSFQSSCLNTRILLAGLLTKRSGTGEGRGRYVGAVDLGMAISAAVGKELLQLGSSCPVLPNRVLGIIDHVPRMALEAEKGHRGAEQVVIDGTMRRMAVGAVFGDVAMLEYKRPLLFHVAPGAGILRSYPPQEMLLSGPVHLVAVDAGNLLLKERMVREELVFGLHFRMAAVAHLCHLPMAHLLLRPLMKLMAIEAAHVVESMGAGIPMSEGGNGSG